jgi:hypothetical protein
VINRGVERTEGESCIFTSLKNIKGEKVETIGDGLNIIASGSPFRGRHQFSGPKTPNSFVKPVNGQVPK